MNDGNISSNYNQEDSSNNLSYLLEQREELKQEPQQ